jgi:polysaccharide biosynthesis/export protein
MIFTRKCLLPAVSLLLLFFLHIQFAQAEYKIGANDVLRITVVGYDELRAETRVSEDGRISFPMIGEVPVIGKSNFEVEHDIASMLAKGGFIIDPQVTVTVIEFKSQQVSVLGQINKPGRYILEPSTTLVDIIAMAGGINNLGDPKVILTRKDEAGNLTKHEIDMRQILETANDVKPFKIEKNDIIYVPKAPLFYIYGEVQRPGGFTIEPQLTVAQAISLGGGLTLRGTERGIIIKRTQKNGKITSIPAELTDQVQKSDVIVVDERWF